MRKRREWKEVRVSLWGQEQPTMQLAANLHPKEGSKGQTMANHIPWRTESLAIHRGRSDKV